MTNLFYSFPYKSTTINISGYEEDDWIYQKIKESNSFYELDLLEYIAYVMKDINGIYIDVGANIGNHSIYFGKILHSNVIAFEPNPDIYEILDRNLKVNSIEYKLYKLGLGDRSATYNLYLPDGAGKNIGATTLRECLDGAISVVKLDSLLNQIEGDFKDKRVVAIKVDIEGMESRMLSGAVNTLAKYRPELFIEANNNESLARIIEILQPLGYIKVSKWAVTPVWHFTHRCNLNFSKIISYAKYNFINKFLKKLKNKCIKLII